MTSSEQPIYRKNVLNWSCNMKGTNFLIGLSSAMPLLLDSNFLFPTDIIAIESVKCLDVLKLKASR